ncbi:MAG TPA: SH3 domain-containing protein [Kofleriaceae bacterium]
MKRVLLLLLLSAGIALAAPKVGSSVTIRVLSAKVMKAPKFIGAAAGSVSRGDQLTVKEVKGDWYRVEGTQSGWIHKTNVTEGKVALSSKPGGSGGNVNRDEVELAGRGFTPEVEQKYKQANPNLDFTHVDAIEKTSVDPGELEAFAAEGKLQ